MNCAKSVKMIVILGCIVVNLVGCGMNDTTASSMSTVVSSQDTSSSSCNSEEKNDLQRGWFQDCAWIGYELYVDGFLFDPCTGK